MIPSQFRFEATFTPEDFAKIGLLALRWSHIDHVIANCLKALLRLTDDEAIVVVFPLHTDTRLTRIRELQKRKPFPTEAATTAFRELDRSMKAIQAIRNTVIHAVIMGDELELRSKERRYTKAQIFEIEELTNYAGHLP
jgi:hypothetical protein